MSLDVKVRLSNKSWARHPVDAVGMWLKCSSTPPFRVGSRSLGKLSLGTTWLNSWLSVDVTINSSEEFTYSSRTTGNQK
jgi:hypothetical protein